MAESIEQLQTEIDDILSELNEMSESIVTLNPVSHKSQAKIQWTGGIPGVIKEIRESKRLTQLINAPIYKEHSFYQLAFLIAQYAEDLTNKQIAIQEVVGKNDVRYFEKVEPIFRIVSKAVSAWYNYSPDMAEEAITIGDEKNVSLGPSIKAWIKDDFAKMDFPPEMQQVKDQLTKKLENNSGCFGIIIIMLMLTTSITAAAAVLF